MAFPLRFSPQQQTLRFLTKISRIRPLDQPGLQNSKGRFLPLTPTQRPSPERRQAPKKRLKLIFITIAVQYLVAFLANEDN